MQETQQAILKFRPFRYVKERVIVTSYMGWRKLAVAAKRGELAVLVANLEMVPQMHVINHEGHPLYFPSEQAFNDNPYLLLSCYDVEGVPVFSHIDAKRIEKSEYKHLFEPLYTNIIVREFHAMNERFKTKWLSLLT